MRTLIALITFSLTAFAAVSSDAQWNVQTGGSSALNGGFFVTGATGTNYSLQNSPQWSVGDAVTNGTQTITSATAVFDATIVGNGCYVQGGTGSVAAAWYEVKTFNSATSIDVDRAFGLTAGTGAVLICGGALDLPSSAIAAILTTGTGKYTIWIKSGTYTQTAPLTIAVDLGLTISGYNTTQGDITLSSQLTRPLITTATNSTNLWALASSGTDEFSTIKNLRFTNTASVRASGFIATGARDLIRIENCLFDGFSTALDGPNGSGTWNWNWLELESVEIKNSTSDAITNVSATGNDFLCRWSWIHDNAGHGVNWSGGGAELDACNLTNNGGSGFYVSAAISYFVASNSNFSFNTSSGVDLTNGIPIGTLPTGHREGLQLYNNVSWGNGAYGILLSGSFNPYFLHINYFNAYGNNTTADRGNFTAGVSDVSLSASPFTSSTDFTLNNTAGGGALLRSTAFPGQTPGGLGYMSIGPLQPNSSGVSTSTIGIPSGN